ncbi:MAG: carbohydrate kinase [Nocardioidaceae bacterium]
MTRAGGTDDDVPCDVTVVGEALVDVVTTASGVRRRPGGSPLNVAVGLARLGWPTCLVAEVGDDPDGTQIRAHLAESGVSEASLLTVPRTSTATATIGAGGSAAYEFDVTWSLRSGLRVSGRLVHTGSIAAVLAPGADRVAELVLHRPPGVLASVDPNIRPEMIPDRAAAVDRIGRLIAAADIVKLSDEDASWLYPGESPESVEQRILGAGVALVATTRGPLGACLRTAGARIEVPAMAESVVDTIGAGDAFMSGLLAGVLTRGLPGGGVDEAARLREIGELAAACAAVVVARQGADPPWAHELRR